MYHTCVSGRVSTGGAHEPFRDHVGKGDTPLHSRGLPRAVGPGGWQQGSRKADQLGPRVRARSSGAGPAEPHPTLTPPHAVSLEGAMNFMQISVSAAFCGPCCLSEQGTETLPSSQRSNPVPHHRWCGAAPWRFKKACSLKGRSEDLPRGISHIESGRDNPTPPID